MVQDLVKIQKELDEINLEKAIRTHDLTTAAACLRKLRYKIPPAIVKIITDYLIDPVTAEKHKYKEGPKPKKKRSFVERNMAVSLYKTLCEEKMLPSRKAAKGLVCKVYGICPRTFETWLAEYNKK